MADPKPTPLMSKITDANELIDELDFDQENADPVKLRILKKTLEEVKHGLESFQEAQNESLETIQDATERMNSVDEMLGRTNEEDKD